MNKITSYVLSFSLFFSSAIAYAKNNDVNSVQLNGQVSVLTLSNSDFTITLNHKSISLGEGWSDDVEKNIGQSQTDDFVGTVDYGDETYKFYRHQYDGLDVYTSNLWWDKAERTVDDYIIAQITLKSSELKTSRGASVGISLTQLHTLYGTGQVTESNGTQRIHYSYGKKRISFKIAGDKVSSIIMSYNKED